MNNIIYIALGSNLGDRQVNLETAIKNLSPEIRVKKRSSIYETPPWGYEDQPAFLNMVIQGRTGLSPEELLMFLKNLETSLGRKVTFRNGPRLIDMDILFYDQLSINQPGLVIPHPRLQERAFVLVPLAELAPDLIHPVLMIKMRELLTSVDRRGITRYFPEITPDEDDQHQ
jgi:2-amino-4-hydroxy-6-hydroxymethyldihydropteridine diphosphokinase